MQMQSQNRLRFLLAPKFFFQLLNNVVNLNVNFKLETWIPVATAPFTTLSDSVKVSVVNQNEAIMIAKPPNPTITIINGMIIFLNHLQYFLLSGVNIVRYFIHSHNLTQVGVCLYHFLIEVYLGHEIRPSQENLEHLAY
jgi:hypothetical protein